MFIYVKNEDFYLYGIAVSNKAIVKIIASKSDDKLMVYTTTFRIKSEYGQKQP